MRLFQRSSPLPHIYPLHQILFYITPSPPSRFRTLSHPPLCHCQPPLENVERTCMDSTHGFNVMPFTTSSGIYSRMAKCLRSPQFSLFLSLHISLFLPGSLFTISILLPPPPPPLSSALSSLYLSYKLSTILLCRLWSTVTLCRNLIVKCHFTYILASCITFTHTHTHICTCKNEHQIKAKSI